MKKCFHQVGLLITLIGLSLPVFSTIYYVAPGGNDANNGSLASPFLSIKQAQTAVVAGDTVYIRGGTYTMAESQIASYSSIWAYVTLLNKSGSSGKRINYWAYPGEKPVFNYTAINPANYRIHAFQVTGSWIHIRGIEVVGVQVNIVAHTQSECFENQGSNNIYEMLSMHDGKAIGFYLTKGGNNLILNCDAYNNWDNVSENMLGRNTDGFGCHPNSYGNGYTNNIFRGCRAWFNSDDGYDCISAFESTTFENCWAFYNGYSQSFGSLGDGNGFKAGGYGTSLTPSVPAVIPRNNVRFCLAIRNKANGFYSNHHPGGSNWFNNSAYFNSVNYNMLNRSADYTADVAGYDHEMKNNLGYGARSTEYNNLNAPLCNADTNYFNLPVTVNSSDFLSTDQALLTAPRQADGSLPVVDFMKLVSGSDVIDKGLNIGYAFYGTAPDLGCFESNYEGLPVDLLSFEAVADKAGNVVLEWQVANQVQNAGWEIERNQLVNNTATAWTKMGFVAGSDSRILTRYSCKDGLLAPGNYQYRLKQMDRDGHVKYSRIIFIKIGSKQSLGLSIYPNPVIDKALIHYILPLVSNVQLSLFNSDGELIKTLVNGRQNAGSQHFQLNAAEVTSKGTCHLRLVSNETVETIGFIR
ncbi:MAG: T9SS type A sorting domain-containing protein [Chitinophagaceae bacterium]